MARLLWGFSPKPREKSSQELRLSLNCADRKFQFQISLLGFGTGMLQSEILSGLCKIETPEHLKLNDGQPANALL